MKTMVEQEVPTATSYKRATNRASSRVAMSADAEQQLQIKTILVPLDFSAASMQVLKYAIPFAEKFKASIHLVYVQPADELTAISGAGRLMLNCADAIALMQNRLSEVERNHHVRFWPDICHLASGRPYEEICKLARELEADLILLPTRGQSRLKHILLGSTTERVVRYAPCPVLVPRGKKYRSVISNGAIAKTKFKMRKILVPVDFSKCSLAGAKYAARLARSVGAGVRLFHVVFPYTQIFGIDRVGADVRPLIERAKTVAEQEMSKLTRMSFLRGVPCETEIRIGPAIDEICRESSRPDIDLAVTSSHGHTGFKRALIGSVAEHVVRYAECPVIIVPSRGGS